ncbi:MAG: hypothetical protein ACYTG6_18235, partial [Planctomycetota bacterium]
MKHIYGTRPIGVIALATVLATLSGASTVRAEPVSGPVAFEIALTPSPWQNGTGGTDVYGTFTATGAIAAEGSADGDTGWAYWQVRLDTSDGAIHLAIDEVASTWLVVRGEGIHEGLAGGGTATAVYGT